MAISIRSALLSDVETLFQESTTILADLYPTESNHFVSAQELLRKKNTLLVAVKTEKPVGCVGFLRVGQYAEVKRLFVYASHRRQGVGRALMVELERRALKAGLNLVNLETGVHQIESIRLYKSMGYQQIPAFGGYENDDFSVFMSKEL